MGNGGSYTTKAVINPNLFVFTKWEKDEMNKFLLRGQRDLSETFGLRRFEFEFLLSKELVDFPTSRALFNELFDTDKNSLVDKFEVMSVICLTSKISNEEKIHFFFELFNFNNKGFLYASELTLLIFAISRGAFKVDQKYIPPPNYIVANLVEEAFTYARLDPNSIRRPELVNFCKGNKDVFAFLESWRGHASQVLVREQRKWRDLSFPCAACSICPSNDWMKLGLPPDHFVRWRRRDRVGVGLGCIKIFSHEISFMKTVDRRTIFSGDGVVGKGYLQQGILADKWVINAFAALAGKPECLAACLPSTGQEDTAGRFCLRLYEGSGWRSVYVDDRLPCDAEGNILFTRSSHSLEAWPSIMEKGFAKYFGSYGHLSVCGSRSDATETALRFLTGGHVQKLGTRDFEWCSVEEEVKTKSGVKQVKMWVKEGSLVSFGRSESLSIMRGIQPKNPVLQKQKTQVLPPHGRLFPLVGMRVEKGYIYFILKDPWGLIHDCEMETNEETGYSRTFQILVEDLPLLYDVLFISRFPDSQKTSSIEAKRTGAPLWNTEVIGAKTEGVRNPAKFILKVLPFNDVKLESEGPQQSLEYRRKSSVFSAEMIDDMIKQSDGREDDSVKIKIREKKDFSREKPSAKIKREKAEEVAKKAEALVKKLPAPSRLADIALTVSSSLDWAVAGSERAKAKMRLRLTPTLKTLKDLMKREQMADEVKEFRKKLEEERKAAQLLLLRPDEEKDKEKSEKKLETDSTETLTDAKNIPLTQEAEITNSNALIDNFKIPELTDEELQNKYAKKFDFTENGPKSWMSLNFHLLPGEYLINVDAEYDEKFEDLYQLSIPADIDEAPWVLKTQLSGSSSRKYNRGTFNQVEFAGKQRKRHGNNKNQLEETFTEDKLLHNIFLQVSSTDKLKVENVSQDNKPYLVFIQPTEDILGKNSFLPSIPTVSPDKWPFSAESQLETSSRVLTDQLTQIGGEAHLIGAEFMSLTKKFKEQRKKELTDSLHRNAIFQENSLSLSQSLTEGSNSTLESAHE